MTQEKMKEMLYEAWKEVFHVDEVADDADFFTAGGDSIMAVQLSTWLIQKGVKLDLVDVFTTPAISDLADKLVETDPVYVPDAMLTKEIAAKEMGFASVEEAENAEKRGLGAPLMDQQVCTPTQQNNQQVCTPAQQNNQQVCTPAQQNNQQICTPAPQNNQQVCTPAPVNNQQICTPMWAQPAFMPMWGQPVYMPMWGQQICTPAPMNNQQICTPAPQNNQQVCTPAPQNNQQVCTPAPQNNQQVCTPAPQNDQQACTPAKGQSPLPPKLQKYWSHTVDAPIEQPNVMKINKAKIAEKSKPADETLMTVMKGLLPNFNKDEDFFEQGLTSLDTVKMVTRCGEAGYQIELKDIYMHSTFEELLGCMK